MLVVKLTRKILGWQWVMVTFNGQKFFRRVKYTDYHQPYVKIANPNWVVFLDEPHEWTVRWLA